MLLSASKDGSSNNGSAPNFKGLKLQIPQGNTTSFSTRTQTDKRAQNEILIHDTASAPLKKRDPLNSVTGTPAVISAQPLDLKNNKLWPLSSPTQKGSFTALTPKDLSSLEYQLHATRQNSSSNKPVPKARDSRQSLIDQNSIVIKNANKYLHTNLEPSIGDWTSINANDNIDEEMEKVKMLDAWQFEMTKEKLSGTLGQTDVTTQYKKPSKQQEDHGFPAVNVKLIQSIMINPEEERKYKKTTNALMAEPYSSQKSAKKHVDFSDGTMQSLENAIRESNQEILYDLISKKIKDFFFKTDIDQMTNEQLKLHTKMIAESVIDQFKSLKGATNLTLIQNRIEYIISRLRSKKNTQVDEMLGYARESMDRVKAKPIVDYKSIESMLIKNYEHSVQSVKDLREKLKVLNKQSFKINNQIKPISKQLEQLNEKLVETNTGSFSEQPSPSKQGSAYKDKRVTVASPSEIGSLTTSAKFENAVDAATGANYIRIQKAKQERKKAKLEIQAQLKDLQKQLGVVTHDTDLSEKELKASRNYKIHYRIQLKELYLKMLKDETSLVDVNNNLNYSWIIRVLWRMNEEVKSHIFPSFLDQTSINFLIDYAKIQDQLETYCRQNGLMFLIANSEEFKDAVTMFDTFASFGNNNDEVASAGHPVAFGSTTGDISAAANEVKEKDFNLLLDKFKNKMNTLKKVNLKARKLTQMTCYNSKGKYVVSKWEDVDPSKATNTNQSQEDAEYMDDRLSRDELNLSKNSHMSLDKAIEILEKLKKMRDEEIARIIKQTLPKDSDDKLKLNLKKIFRFLFGKKEGEKGYHQCIKEKSSNDQKNLRHVSAYHQKSNTEADTPATQKFMVNTSYPVENQIWNSPKADNLFTPSDYTFGSASKLNPMSSLDSPATGDSVFRSAAANLLNSNPIKSS